jgi:hypothetical protein
LKKEETEILQELEGSDFVRSDLVKCIRQLETSIKYDIAIYTIEPFPGIGGFNPVKDFEQAEETMKKIRGRENDNPP